MAEDTSESRDWRGLYETFSRVKDLAPWEWMEEADVFGVRDPETEELGFVSTMGMLGEHYAVSLYRGPEGLYEFRRFQELGPMLPPEGLLEIPQLQASFEDREQLEKRDRDQIKALGLKFRGRKSWPMFRDFRPGLFPWFIEAGDVRFLRQALEQLLDVAPRFEEDPSLLETASDETYLTREPRREGGGLVWEDRLVDVPPPESVDVEVEIEPEVAQGLERLPQARMRLEMDFFMLPSPVQENRRSRPYFPYMLMAVDAGSGMVLGHEMLYVETSLPKMWASILPAAARTFINAGALPEEVAVGSDLLFQLLQPLAGLLDFDLDQPPELPNLSQAREMILRSVF